MIATEDFRCGAVVQQGHGDSAVCGRPNYGTDNWQRRDCAISERDQLKDENEALRKDAERFAYIERDADSGMSKIYGDDWVAVIDAALANGEQS